MDVGSLFALLLSGLGVVLLVGIALLLAVPIIRGAPFVPTRGERVQKMVELARVRRGELMLDLGAGDGRVVIAFARAGAIAYGYEINPLLVLWAQHKIRRAGLEDRTFVYWKNFWSANFSSFDIITVFGIGHIMGALEKKLRRELKGGARIVSNAFRLPNWSCIKHEDGVYLYD